MNFYNNNDESNGMINIHHQPQQQQQHHQPHQQQNRHIQHICNHNTIIIKHETINIPENNHNNNNNINKNENNNNNNSIISKSEKDEAILLQWSQIANEEEYDSDAINILYDNLLKESLQAYSESKNQILLKNKPNYIKLDRERPFNSVNDNIITKILNYLDLYSVIYFTQTCKKVAMANQSPFLLSSYFPNSNEIDNNNDNNNNNNNYQITQSTSSITQENEEILRKKKATNPFSFLDPIDLTKIKFVNPITNDIIYPFAHLEINEEPELPDIDDEFVNNFVVNPAYLDIESGKNNTNQETLKTNNKQKTENMPYLDLDAPAYVNNKTNVISFSPTTINDKKQDTSMINMYNNPLTIDIRYQLNRNN